MISFSPDSSARKRESRNSKIWTLAFAGVTVLPSKQHLTRSTFLSRMQRKDLLHAVELREARGFDAGPEFVGFAVICHLGIHE